MLVILLQHPPDVHVETAIRLMCTRNDNDDYCYVAFENIDNDKSAPDFDVRLMCTA